MDDKDLERLMDRFRQLLPDLLSTGHRGEWAVVSDAGLLATEADFGRAYRLAQCALADKPFIVQRVLPPDHAERIIRIASN
jgi:hypothetical protein